MIKIIKPLESSLKSVNWTYIISNNDSLSESKVCGKTIKIPRSRRVGQSFYTSVFTTIQSILYIIPILFIQLPDVIIVNGPGVCIPPCLIAFILKVVGLKHVSIVFIESLARVKHLSLTGKLLLPIADRFLVQWPYLKGSIAEYHGRLV